MVERGVKNLLVENMLWLALTKLTVYEASSHLVGCEYHKKKKSHSYPSH